jgi:uncharacterized protein
MTEVRNNEGEHRFETEVNGEPAVLEYRIRDNALWLLHTEVPQVGQGSGVGAALVRAAFEHASAQEMRVVPMCSFVASYVRRHPEYLDAIDPAFRSRVTGER